MPDVFANITGAPPEALEMIANVLELRAAIPQQQEMLRTYLRDIDFPEGDFHPGIEHATVISGSAHWGMGEKFEADKLRAMPAGSFIMICAGAPHFGQITEDTIIQAHGMGPWRTTSEATPSRRQALALRLALSGKAARRCARSRAASGRGG